jgi:hypothetical protein
MSKSTYVPPKPVEVKKVDQKEANKAQLLPRIEKNNEGQIVTVTNEPPSLFVENENEEI